MEGAERRHGETNANKGQANKRIECKEVGGHEGGLEEEQRRIKKMENGERKGDQRRVLMREREERGEEGERGTR